MSESPSLETLGTLVAGKRGKVGVRSTARDIGISPATLSRIENGHLPDLENFKKVCNWLDIDPSKILGFDGGADNPSVSVHFRKTDTMSPETGKALSEMIQAAHVALVGQG